MMNQRVNRRRERIIPTVGVVSALTVICVVIGGISFDKMNAKPKSPLLVAKLIHPHSTLSPIYNPKFTIEQLAEMDTRASFARLSWIHNSSFDHKINSQLNSASSRTVNGFLAYLKVGQLRVKQYLVMDTGSRLTWLNCMPFGSYRATALEPVFDPSKSSTYTSEHCQTSEFCGSIGSTRTHCDKFDRCVYSIRYAHESTSAGHLARETFVFVENEAVEDDVVFGCCRSSNLVVHGILGLAPDKISLLNQRLSSRFAYCLGKIHDKSYNHHRLMIGDQVKPLSIRTPMIIDGMYYINLKSIKLIGDDQPLDIDPRIFERDQDAHKGGMIVDTGATLSFLPQPAYKLAAKISSLIEDIPSLVGASLRTKNTELCYNGVVTRDLKSFPELRFMFEGGAVMNFGTENLFRQVSDERFCLAILQSPQNLGRLSLLGSWMQQGFYVVFDLKDKLFYFKRMSCQDNIYR